MGNEVRTYRPVFYKNNASFFFYENIGDLLIHPIFPELYIEIERSIKFYVIYFQYLYYRIKVLILSYL